MDKNENLKYQLETLASYQPEDLDNPEFDVAYETESGFESFATVCCIDAATRSLKRIRALEAELAAFKNPKNWTRPFDFKGNLIVTSALYVPKLAI